MDIDTMLARHDPAGRLPLPGPDSAEAITLYQQIIRPGGAGRMARSPRRRIVIGAVSGATAVLGAGLAVGLTLGSLPGVTQSASRAPGHPAPPASGGAITAHLTAKQVLSKAAAAALSEPRVTPRPDQFVYTKITNGAHHVTLTWASVDGSRNSLVKGDFGGSGSTTILGCVNGKRKIHLAGRNGKPLRLPHHKPGTPITKLPLKGSIPMDGPVVTEPCTPELAFFPDMPTTASAMPAYLATQGITPSNLNNLAKSIGEIFEGDYLLPAQRAALYQFLATTPGLSVEHNTQDISGRPGIGVRWSFGGGDDLLIFDPRNYTFLGSTTHGENGELGGDALLQMAIVNHAGQLP